MTGVLGDVRVALRVMAKNPGFSAVVVVALGLGLGVNSAVFGAANFFLMRSLPVAHPENLVSIYMGPRAEQRVWGDLSYPDYLDLRQQQALFSDLVATTIDGSSVTDDLARPAAHPESAVWELATGNLFQMLGVGPVIGRIFSPADDDPRAPAVAVLSHAFWRRRFNADPAVLGRHLSLAGFSVTVIGVMPPSFKGPQDALAFGVVDCWLPLALRARIYRGTDPTFLVDRTRRGLRLLGRLAPGVAPGQAQARLDVLAGTLAQQHPIENAGTRLAVTSEIEGRYGPRFGLVKLGFALALLVAGLVLIIACANVANLLLARAATRTREMGIRVALGAGRSRIIRQLLTESLLLALLGGALGLLLARWFGDLLRLSLPRLPFQPNFDFPADHRTFAWAVGATVLAGLGFGAAPAWRASRTDVVTSLKSDLTTEGHRLRRAGLRQLLVIAQLSIAIPVLAAGGLFFRSLHRIERIDPGYRVDNLVSALVNPSLYTDDPVQMTQFFGELLRRLERLPGVRAVSSARYLPLVNLGGTCTPVVREGAPPPPPNQASPIRYSVVYRGYFQTMETPLVAGRDFLDREHEGAPSAVIINAQLAQRLFGGPEAAVGRRLWIADPRAPLLRVVGVAQDGRYETLLEDPRPWIFLPVSLPWLHDTNEGMRTVLMRVTDRSAFAATTEALRREVERLDPRLPLEQVLHGQQHLALSLLEPRLAAQLGSILGVLALLLAALGIFTVMTYTVSQRTREIGIRMALGGQAGDILRLVLRQGMGLVAAGAAVGALIALAVGSLVSRFLYGVSPADPLTLAAAVLLLALVALLAIAIPVRRATRVDPMVALRPR
jgi:predicted permease